MSGELNPKLEESLSWYLFFSNPIRFLKLFRAKKNKNIDSN